MISQQVFDFPMVGAARFELATLCSQSRCATRLRYAPIHWQSLTYIGFQSAQAGAIGISIPGKRPEHAGNCRQRPRNRPAACSGSVLTALISGHVMESASGNLRARDQCRLSRVKPMSATGAKALLPRGRGSLVCRIRCIHTVAEQPAKLARR
jgi:hypothetical protein